MLTPKTILALDVGERRIGVAMANTLSRLPSPLVTIDNVSDALQTLVKLVYAHNAKAIVIGLPRGLKGQETAQTGFVREFIDLLKEKLKIPIYTQDEAMTSIQAEKELEERGVSYNKGAVDALAATYILEDYFRENPDLDK